jgi:hypothetical protein
MTTSRSSADLRQLPPDVTAFRTPVRGHAYAAAPPGASRLEQGLYLRLVPEPDNPADPLAIAIWTVDGVPWRIGYLERGVAARLASRLRRGDRLAATLDGWWDAPGGWERPVAAVTIIPDQRRRGAPAAWGKPPRSVIRPVRQSAVNTA